ncbi:10080_t:CDS:2 [Entrophospora sp. SA101]|nr:10080_t:CDS:2 [Entrophospora sp. SA101]
MTSLTPLLNSEEDCNGLENAIFVAWILNRTLIVPPALLLTKFRVSFGRMTKLSKYLRDEPVGSICGNIKIKRERQKCESFHNSYTLYPYDQLFDFTFIRQNLKTINAPNFDLETVIEMLNITEPRKEIYFDFTYEYDRMYDTEEKPHIETNGLLESLQLFKKRPEKLIYFGSLFGSGRIHKGLESSKIFFKKLQESFVPNNPVILSVVSSVVEKMGGVGDYISAHARGGDNVYAKKSKEHFTDLVMQIDKKYPEIPPYLTSLKNECPPIDKGEITKRNLYVASDVGRENESMKVILDKFPCLRMLSDFRDQLEPYGSLINPVDNKVMSRFLIPLTDLMVAANGFEVFTIRGSTYGAYLKRYHKFLKKKVIKNPVMQRLVRISGLQEKKFFAVEQICDVTHKSMLLANCHFVGYMEELGGLPTSVLKQLKITYSVCLVLCPVDFNVTKVAGIWNALSSSAENSILHYTKLITLVLIQIQESGGVVAVGAERRTNNYQSHH